MFAVKLVLLLLLKKDRPGHQLVELLLALVVLGCDGVLRLLLHPLHKMLHVLESVDLEEIQEPTASKP